MAAVAFFACVAAGAVLRAQPAPSLEVLSSTKSDVEFYVTNDGIFGLDREHVRSGLIYPRGSGLTYMFGSGLWFGAQKRSADTLVKLVFLTYNLNAGTSWATPGEFGDTIAPAPLYYSREHDRITGTHKDSGSADVKPRWPLWLPRVQSIPTFLAPGVFETDTTLRNATGSYSRPAFVPNVDEQFTARFNDSDLERYEVDTKSLPLPMRLQMQGSAYAWQQVPFANAVIVQYEVINHSTDTLFNCVLAQASEVDIGASANDHIRFYSERPELRAGYAWTEPEAGKQFGALGMTLLEAPVTDAGGFVINADRGLYRDFGRAGAFPEWTPPKTDPQTVDGRYDLLSTPSFISDHGAGDQRALLASTPFNMAPGDTAHYAMAYMLLNSVPEIGRAGHHDPRIASTAGPTAPELELMVSQLLDAYYGILASGAPAAPRDPGITLQVTPMPARGTAMLGITCRESTPIVVTLVDVLGRIVRRIDAGSGDAGRHDVRIDMSDLPAGMYYARVAAGTEGITAPLMHTR